MNKDYIDIVIQISKLRESIEKINYLDIPEFDRKRIEKLHKAMIKFVGKE